MNPVTVRTLRKMKRERQPITMLTAYDATFARLLDSAGVDMLLVGDSLGMVIKGEDNTLNVTIDEIAYHVRAVSRGAARAHVVGDMPFLSFQVSAEEAIRNAGKLLQAGAQSVKLEGGVTVADTVRRLVAAGIPVMGHIGLVPQSVNAMGGFVVQGKDEASQKRLLEDARALEEAGAYAVVLEGIPSDLATELTAQLSIPTIGIGAGPGCDGQVLVIYDLLGLNPDFKPKFVKRFADGAGTVVDACRAYVDEVKHGVFPDEAHSFAGGTPYSAPTGAAKTAPGEPGTEPSNPGDGGRRLKLAL